MWDGQGYYCDERCVPDTEQSRWTSMVINANYDASIISGQLSKIGITHLLMTGDLDFVLDHDPDNENFQAVKLLFTAVQRALY